jgi:hypothetical protein
MQKGSLCGCLFSCVNKNLCDQAKSSKKRVGGFCSELGTLQALIVQTDDFKKKRAPDFVVRHSLFLSVFYAFKLVWLKQQNL